MSLEKKKAQEIFNNHYHVIQEYGDDEMAEEILISVLAIKHSILSCKMIIKLCESERYFYESVIKELKKM